MNLKLVIEADSTTLINLLKLLPETPMTAEVNVTDQQPSLPLVPTDEAPTFDNTGLPYDERIHAPSKSLNADGTWRKKRNVDDTLYKAVEAELRAGGSAPFVGNVEPVATESGVVVVETVINEEYIPVPPPIPAPVSPVPLTAPATALDYHTLLSMVGPAISNGQLAVEKTTQVTQALNALHGLTMQSLADLGDKPHLIQSAYDMLFGQGA